VALDGDELRCNVVYNVDLWTPATAARFADHWSALLRHVARAPSSRPGDLSLLSERERRLLLEDWNAADLPVPDRRLGDRVEHWSTATPANLALADEHTRLSYAELRSGVRALSRRLVVAGVGRESRVGLLLERSAAFVVGALGILDAGGAYVPLDPAHPAARIGFLVRDAGIDVVVTHPHRHSALLDELGAERGGRQLLVVDASDAPSGDLADSASTGGTSAARTPTTADLAYLMYTSGSTGHPKGVCSTHGGPVNLLDDLARRQRLGPDDVCSWWTSGGFDVSVYEIFAALDAGATLLVVPADVRPHPLLLAAWLADNGVTCAYVPPFALAALAEHAESRDARPLVLRNLVVSVEPIPEPLLQRLVAALPGLRIVNGYGPTETTIFSTLHDVDPTNGNLGVTPIGRAVQNGPVTVVDRSLRMVPIGVPGELCVGGVGLARGYQGRPGATAERFVPDAFSTMPGARMYRTGDVVRYRADGVLQFLGRRDFQVKLRGLRIELGEVEAVIARHPDVSSAVVTVREVGGQPVLVAYVVSRGDQGPDQLRDEVLAHVRRLLPAAMVPSTVVPLDAWPVTVNGKLDRHALPDPAVVASRPYEPPHTAMERAVSTVWSRLLGGRRVGRFDDFFASGGHSLLAARATLMLGELLGVDVPVVLLFSHPTPAQLAVALDELVAAGAEETAIPTLPRSGAATDVLVALVGGLPASVVDQLLGERR
jgi:amino acid adenylation domain-containing protein